MSYCQMMFMSLSESYVALLQKLPGIAGPIKRLTFRDKLMWTGIVLILYFVMAQVMVYGINPDNVARLSFLEILLGSSFGSIMTLSIGPIVTASIVLQLMVGSKLIPWDLGTDMGRTMFQGTQKLAAIGLSFVEAFVYVAFGAVPAASPALFPIVVLQLALGGVLVIFMDELISKWGFGSGVGLFIVAGVSKTIVVRMFNPLTESGLLPNIPATMPAGAIPSAIISLMGGQLVNVVITILPVIATVIVFLLVIYANGIKVEIPLAFGSVRGFGRRWPLRFFYTSNIPVILVAALLANIQLMGRIASQNPGLSWLGTFDSSGNVSGGLLLFMSPPTSSATAGMMVFIGLFAIIGVVAAYLTKKDAIKFTAGFAVLGGISWFGMLAGLGLTGLLAIPPIDIIRMLTYAGFMIGGSMIFSYFWMNTAGMDPANVAKQIQDTGMQIPGYRRDIRIIERVLGRYIPALTIMGGAAIGALAAYADFTLALGTGTGILLATMIVFQMYEQIAQQHMEDMHPAFRRLIGK